MLCLVPVETPSTVLKKSIIIALLKKIFLRRHQSLGPGHDTDCGSLTSLYETMKLSV